MITDGETQVGDGHHDGHLVLGHKEPHQPRLEHVGGEEGEKDNNQGENQTNILNTEIKHWSLV